MKSLFTIKVSITTLLYSSRLLTLSLTSGLELSSSISKENLLCSFVHSKSALVYLFTCSISNKSPFKISLNLSATLLMASVTKNNILIIYHHFLIINNFYISYLITFFCNKISKNISKSLIFSLFLI